jgi:hypothetical protein
MIPALPCSSGNSEFLNSRFFRRSLINRRSSVENGLMLEQDKWSLFYVLHRREESPGSAGQDAG